VVAGRNELGMLRREPESSAAEKEGWTCGGREGSTTFWRWDLMPPEAREAVGVLSRTSTRARVS